MRIEETAESVRVLLAGVGYGNLSDLSFGPILVERLKRQAWPSGIEVEDLSYHPVAVIQKFMEPEHRYDKIVLSGAVTRGDPPGTVRRYRPQGELPDETVIQNCVVEGVTGIVSLENLVTMTRYFGVWPEGSVVIEVEPEEESWGESLTEPVEAAFPEVLRLIQEEIGLERLEAGWKRA